MKNVHQKKLIIRIKCVKNLKTLLPLEKINYWHSGTKLASMHIGIEILLQFQEI